MIGNIQSFLILTIDNFYSFWVIINLNYSYILRQGVIGVKWAITIEYCTA